MRRNVLILLAVLAVAAIFFAARRRSAPPQIPFARAVREEIVSSLATNGKVQPVEWAEAHSDTSGAVERVLAQKGQSVASGAPLVQLDTRALRSELAGAEARVAQAQAELQTLRQGGRSSDVSTLEGSLATARQESLNAERDLASLKRLQAKGAATLEEVRAAQDRAERAQLQIQGLESRRQTLVNRPDISAAEARLREAEAGVATARTSLSMATIFAPISGTIYQLDVRPGAYLTPGSLVAAIGKLDQVRVVVYVDEPDLGRVQVGKPVQVTWDAIPGRTWQGTVEKLPLQVTALGTRQVGEVISIISNPDHDLLPGTNVNVDIRAQSVSNAIVIPTAALRRDNGKTGVYLLSSGQIEWRPVQLGVASAARTQVEGIREGDSVALPSEKPIKPGMPVTPVYP